MKNLRYISILYVICGIISAASFLSCKMDEPGPPPAEELFLRAFIKKYGLIDPNQDWNEAKRASVTVDVDYARQINVFVRVLDCYYRVANYMNVYGEVEISVDIPDGVDKMFVDVDGKFFSTEVGGHVNAKAPARSRAATDYNEELWEWQNWSEKSTQDVPMASGSFLNCAERFYLPNPTAGCADSETNRNHWSRVSSDNLSLLTLTEGTKVYMQMHNTKTSVATLILRFHTYVADPATIQVRVGSLAGVTLDLIGEQDHEILIFNVVAGAWPQMGIYVAEGLLNSIGNFSITDFAGYDMSWVVVAEDLGTTEDFDFNDVVFNITAISTNTASARMQDEFWQVFNIDDEHIIVSKPNAAPARADASRAQSYTKLQITPLCSGGILDSFLHFATDDQDFILGPGDWNAVSGIVPDDEVEWHSWFVGGEGGEANHREMLNTGLKGNTVYAARTATLLVPEDFSITQYSRIFRVYDETNETSAAVDSWNNLSGWERGNEAGYKILGFYLTVGGANKADADRLLGAPKPGAAPQMFLIPDVGYGGCWHWPRERVPINNVYDKFGGWVTGANPQWYLEAPKEKALTHEGDLVDGYIRR